LVFKRRDKRTYFQIASNAIYPRGGWGRAISYVGYRLTRLPDPPSRIARGIGAGAFVSFTPFFGFHFIVATIIAFLVRGNIIAAVLATFVGNPITFPFIAATAIEIGDRILGVQTTVPLPQVFSAFSQAFAELWKNVVGLVTQQPVHWEHLAVFFKGVFLPYLVGGLLPGTVVGVIAYFVSRPLIEAYQRRRARVLKQRFQERLHAKLQADRRAAIK
jgi:uncharacterized protein (DUF2062 family)